MGSCRERGEVRVRRGRNVLRACRCYYDRGICRYSKRKKREDREEKDRRMRGGKPRRSNLECGMRDTDEGRERFMSAEQSSYYVAWWGSCCCLGACSLISCPNIVAR